jgi:hypothetical protein
MWKARSSVFRGLRGRRETEFSASFLAELDIGEDARGERLRAVLGDFIVPRKPIQPGS